MMTLPFSDPQKCSGTLKNKFQNQLINYDDRYDVTAICTPIIQDDIKSHSYRYTVHITDDLLCTHADLYHLDCTHVTVGKHEFCAQKNPQSSIPPSPNWEILQADDSPIFSFNVQTNRHPHIPGVSAPALASQALLVRSYTPCHHFEGLT